MTDVATKDMHIGFDMDGVLIDHAANKQAAAAGHNIFLAHAQTVSGIFQQYIPVESKADIEYRVYTDPAAIAGAKVMEGAQEFLQHVQLRNVAHTLISRRQDPAVARMLLEHHVLRPMYFDDANTFFVPDKPSKNTIAQQVGVTHYIDDEPSVLEHLVSVPNKFLFDPYKVWPDSDQYIRVTSWDQVSRIIFPND